MHINFNTLNISELSSDEFIRLVAIKQKESWVPQDVEDPLNSVLIQSGYVSYDSNKMYLTTMGASFMSAIDGYLPNSEVSEAVAYAESVYTDRLKDAGVHAEVERRMSWFFNETGFSAVTIKDAIMEYVDNSGKYTLSLPNLIWKAPSVLSTHMTLANSRLFDEIAKKYNIDANNFFKYGNYSKNKTKEYILSIVKMPSPTNKVGPEYTFTGSYKSDAERLIEIKRAFFSSVRK